MQSLTQPTLLLKPFAQSGDKNSIPSTNTDAQNPQLADLTNGFPPITSEDPSDGGLPPERKDLNGLGYLTTTYDYFYQAGGTFTFNQTISNAIGGYPLGARLWYTDSSGIACILRSTIANNTNNFLTNSSVIGEVGSGKPWVIDRFRGYNTIYNLFDTKWTDYELSSQDWLRADTFSWQNGTTYSDAYQHLVADYNGGTSQTETVGSYTITYRLASDGHKIALANQENVVQNIYNESGVAWYYILDTANQRFKLPRENPAREVLGQSAAVIGNGKTLGLKSANNEYVMGTGGNTNIGVGVYNATIGSSISGGSAGLGALGITTDGTKSGIIAQLSETTGLYKGKKYLYFYVGQFSQSAIEQTAGLNAELFNGKVDLDFNNMNPSQSARQTIVGWGLPDYQNADETNLGSISSGHTYTATTNGTLHVVASGNRARAAISFIKSDNSKLLLAQSVYPESASTTQAVWVYAKAGQKFELTGAGSLNAFFCPVFS